MRSASAIRAGLLVLCGLALLGTLGGCTTTQETAARVRAKSERILHARKQELNQRAKTKRKGNQR